MISEYDFLNLDTHGYIIELDESKSFATIDLPHAKVTISKRPGYCDRGRWNVWVQVKSEHIDKMNVDEADAFPRYFFKLENLFDEIHEWISFNKKNLGLDTEPKKNKL